jgi:hypothetical protein
MKGNSIVSYSGMDGQRRGVRVPSTMWDGKSMDICFVLFIHFSPTSDEFLDRFANVSSGILNILVHQEGPPFLPQPFFIVPSDIATSALVKGSLIKTF